jgi:ferredoxin-thioredoxin reductase catalytic subunit|eukprot:COSAG06_NODE_217_length_20094_cov_61.998500_9_plen_544_part_00
MRAASACGLLLGLAYGAPTPTVAAASSSAALRLLSSSDSSAAELHGRRLQGGARPCAAGYSLNPAAAWACDAANGTASLDAQICIPNVCTCAFGAGVVSGTTNPALGLCEEDGAADCSACHTGYDLDAPAGAGAQACIVGGCNTVADLDATTSCIDTLHWPYDAAASCTGLAAFEPAAAAIRVIQRYSDGAKATQARLDSASATGSFACAPGYHLNPNVQFVCGALGGVATLNAQACLPNVCTCPAGNATVAVGLDWGEAFLCEEHGAVDCSSCWDLRAPQANSGGCSGSQQLGATYNGWGQPCNSNSRYVITAPAGPGAQACIQDGCHTVADLDDSPSCGLAECNQTKYTSSYCASLGLFYDNSNPDHTTNVDIECCVGSWTGCGGNCRRYYQHCTGLAAFEPAAATATQRYNKEPLYTPATQALLNGASATGSFACATGYKLNPDVQFVCGLNRGLSQHYQQSEYPNFTPSTWPTRLNAQVCLRGEDVCTCAFGTATVGSGASCTGILCFGYSCRNVAERFSNWCFARSLRGQRYERLRLL